MPNAIANPEEIIKFSNVVEHYIQVLDEETGRMDSAFQQLGDTWKDQQRASFEETYRSLNNTITAFKNNAQEQIPHLRQMAADLETYLGR